MKVCDCKCYGQFITAHEPAEFKENPQNVYENTHQCSNCDHTVEKRQSANSLWGYHDFFSDLRRNNTQLSTQSHTALFSTGCSEVTCWSFSGVPSVPQFFSHQSTKSTFTQCLQILESLWTFSSFPWLIPLVCSHSRSGLRDMQPSQSERRTEEQWGGNLLFSQLFGL